MKTRNLTRRLQHGFSLIEMMLVVAIMGVISAGILSQMNEAQQRGYSEQVKLDNFQEARDFVDQFLSRHQPDRVSEFAAGRSRKPFVGAGVVHPRLPTFGPRRTSMTTDWQLA